jgi:asparagine synthase (glutamine-hydrolysing)
MDFMMDFREGILTKMESAASLAGAAVRHPFLDVNIYASAWGLPKEMKIHRNKQKVVLRTLLERHLPAELVNRPKMGFGAPVSSWLRGPLRDWAETLLSPDLLEHQGIFDSGRVSLMWRSFLSGQKKWHTHLWPILCFQAWHCRRQRPMSSSDPR